MKATDPIVQAVAEAFAAHLPRCTGWPEHCCCGHPTTTVADFLAHRAEAAVAKARPLIAAQTLREMQALIAFERSNAPEYTLTVDQQAAWRIGMARAHRLVRDRADRIEREATS